MIRVVRHRSLVNLMEMVALPLARLRHRHKCQKFPFVLEWRISNSYSLSKAEMASSQMIGHNRIRGR
jgi:hypothetical protein